MIWFQSQASLNSSPSRPPCFVLWSDRNTSQKVAVRPSVSYTGPLRCCLVSQMSVSSQWTPVVHSSTDVTAAPGDSRWLEQLDRHRDRRGDSIAQWFKTARYVADINNRQTTESISVVLVSIESVSSGHLVVKNNLTWGYWFRSQVR